MRRTNSQSERVFRNEGKEAETLKGTKLTSQGYMFSVNGFETFHLKILELHKDQTQF